MILTDCTTAKGAYAYAISLLARREYSRYALHTRLIEKGASPDVADAVLNELQEHHLQNDARFIQSLVRVRIAQGKGPCILYQEAKTHQIPLSMLYDAIAAESPDWVALAASVLEKRFGFLAKTWKEKAHQYRFLMMRGFEKEQIYAVLPKGN